MVDRSLDARTLHYPESRSIARESWQSVSFPPNLGLEIEQAIIGAILLNNAVLAIVSAHMSVEDFGEPWHAKIFDLAADFISKGMPATPATLAPFLGSQPITTGFTPGAYLARLCARATPPILAAGQAKVVRSIAVRRSIAQIGTAVAELAAEMNAHDDPSTVAADALTQLQQVVVSNSIDTAQHAGDLADKLLQAIDGVRSGDLAYTVVSTGYPGLDRAINGYEPGTLVVSAGRPGMGKTAFMGSSSLRCAKTGVGVLQFPLEIGVEQLIQRLLSDLAFFGDGRSAEFRNIGRRAVQLTEEQLSHVRTARDRLRALPIVIDARARVTVAQVAAKVTHTKRVMAAQGVKLGVIFIDHLDYVQASDRYKGFRVQEIGEICLGLKALARAEDICVVLLSQLNRDVDKRPEHERRPTLADLRNSGDIEQVADVVIFLYRPEYYLARSPDYLAGEADALAKLDAARGKLELVLGKVRAGPTPTVHLYCAPAASSISSDVRGTV